MRYYITIYFYTHCKNKTKEEENKFNIIYWFFRSKIFKLPLVFLGYGLACVFVTSRYIYVNYKILYFFIISK